MSNLNKVYKLNTNINRERAREMGKMLENLLTHASQNQQRSTDLIICFAMILINGTNILINIIEHLKKKLRKSIASNVRSLFVI